MQQPLAAVSGAAGTSDARARLPDTKPSVTGLPIIPIGRPFPSPRTMPWRRTEHSPSIDPDPTGSGPQRAQAVFS